MVIQQTVGKHGVLLRFLSISLKTPESRRLTRKAKRKRPRYTRPLGTFATPEVSQQLTSGADSSVVCSAAESLASALCLCHPRHRAACWLAWQPLMQEQPHRPAHCREDRKSTRLNSSH